MDTISVKEYADLIGVTRQAVYQKLKSSLKEYVVKVANPSGRDEIRLKLDILTAAQQEEYKRKTLQVNLIDQSIPFKQSLNNVENAVNNDLLEQLRQKDAEIEFLREQLSQSIKTVAMQHEELQRMRRLLLPAADQQEPEQHTQQEPAQEPVKLSWRERFRRLFSE